MSRVRKPGPVPTVHQLTLQRLDALNAVDPDKGVGVAELPPGADLNALNRLFSRGFIGRAGTPTVYFLTEAGAKAIRSLPGQDDGA